MTDNEEESSRGSRNDKSMVFHHAKIEVKRFTGANNFGMWRCEVKDALCQQDLEDILGDKPDDIEENVWIKMNNRACGIIRSWLAKEIKYFVMSDTSTKEIWRKLEEKYLTKTIQNQNYLLRNFYHIDMRLDLVNVGVDVSDETKAICYYFHCCPLRELFSSFEKIENASVVLMGNDNPCQIMGVGNIRLKMFDRIVRELNNVRYVPGMKKNLISFLEAKGSSVSTQADQGIIDQQSSTDSDGMIDEEAVDDTKHVDSIDEGPIAARLPKMNIGAPKRITDDMQVSRAI
ncbi:hypothetical protein V2J09_021022 [Rumex salicifolius]